MAHELHNKYREPSELPADEQARYQRIKVLAAEYNAAGDSDMANHLLTLAQYALIDWSYEAPSGDTLFAAVKH